MREIENNFLGCLFYVVATVVALVVFTIHWGDFFRIVIGTGLVFVWAYYSVMYYHEDKGLYRYGYAVIMGMIFAGIIYCIW